MGSGELRKRFLEFFKERGHSVIPSSSLVPGNDPTTLFTGSGMQPLIPYLLGQKHPMGTRLVDSQKCFRADDIEEVGDNRHTTFFEMLGNWSLGDYFKEEQLPWFFSFLVDELGLDPQKLYVTVFAGDPKNNIPKDEESIAIWKRLFAEKGIEAKDVVLDTSEKGSELGMQGARIFAYNAKKNWWSRAGAPENMPPGEPGGPDSEVFFEFTQVEHNLAFGQNCHPNCDCGRFLEIGNSVFMEYKKQENGGFEKLVQRNVDFGGGLERITAASNADGDVFKIDTLHAVIQKIEELSGARYESAFQQSFRVVADHIRGAAFMIADGVLPSNTERGYFVRRLLRRAVRHADKLGMKQGVFAELVSPAIENYGEQYPEIKEQEQLIKETIQKEEVRFRETLAKGLKEFEKLSGKGISGYEAFNLYQSYGFPLDVTLELAKEKNIEVDRDGFQQEFQKHQEVSRTGAAGRFKGGLADASVETTRLHTANHLLLAALRQVLGEHVHQRGSNITAERIRLDFSHPQKAAPEELKKVEELVNEKIQEGLGMIKREMSKEEAQKLGAEMEFGIKYGDVVSVYFAEDEKGNVFSKEFCGGPHVKNTSELGKFKILKEEAVSAGIRRIRAVLD
ncbi:MAG: Alanine--tRNA ligase [Parcubacteria group bacterium Greene0714_21]|nr:MAG: Alanine--tRNA ligase [Parcubacteria group bacterium Greene0416_39]TSC97720.1 MAG: Alanine--tRNA ligase [Parcubacteria group bacterium Greene1014_47]TSD04357.1 MAG: Alanine--tRNA ligase [Parcubacteria group bacterium Greene0714_21]